MTTPLSQFDKPDAGQYSGQRKLFLVPNFVFAPGAPEDGQRLLERYWSEVRDHIYSLERRLGQVTHIYHEMLFAEGEEGMKLLEDINPAVCSFISAMCQSTARLEVTEDRELVEESMDWQRCITVGLVSEKVSKLAWDSYREATRQRLERISARINETLKENEVGVMFAREDQGIQFPPGVQVFYVAPPSLDALKRWISDQMRTYSQAGEQQE